MANKIETLGLIDQFSLTTSSQLSVALDNDYSGRPRLSRRGRLFYAPALARIPNQSLYAFNARSGSIEASFGPSQVQNARRYSDRSLHYDSDRSVEPRLG